MTFGPFGWRKSWRNATELFWLGSHGKISGRYRNWDHTWIEMGTVPFKLALNWLAQSHMYEKKRTVFLILCSLNAAKEESHSLRDEAESSVTAIRSDLHFFFLRKSKYWRCVSSVHKMLSYLSKMAAWKKKETPCKTDWQSERMLYRMKPGTKRLVLFFIGCYQNTCIKKRKSIFSTDRNWFFFY